MLGQMAGVTKAGVISGCSFIGCTVKSLKDGVARARARGGIGHGYAGSRGLD